MQFSVPDPDNPDNVLVDSETVVGFRHADSGYEEE